MRSAVDLRRNIEHRAKMIYKWWINVTAAGFSCKVFGTSSR